MTMSLEIDLVGELYNPLYLFPIISVVFCAFLVYAFGFRGEVQPPTFQGNQIQNEKIKTKRKRIKDTNSKMSKPNGHIGNNVNTTPTPTKPVKDDHQLKDEAKIANKSVAKEAAIQTITSKSPSKQVKEASPTKQVKEVKAQQVKSTTTIKTVKDVNDNESLDHVKKKKKKSKSKGQKEGADDDGWVTVKERKIRKPKDDKSAASNEKSSKAK